MRFRIPGYGKREIMIARIRDIADRYRRVGESGYAVTLDNAADPFTFLPYPRLEPANNASGREIRQIIMQRNTRQKHGSVGEWRVLDVL